MSKLEQEQQALISFGQAVATALHARGSWDPSRDWFYSLTNIEGAPDVELAIDARVSYRDRGSKAEIRVQLPSRPGFSWHGERPKIGVSVSREPIAVAADIRRRLLPDAIHVTAECRAKIGQDIGREYAERTACTQLGITPQRGSSRGSRYLDGAEGTSVDVQVREGAHIHFRIDTNDLALAKQLIALIEARSSEGKAA